MSLKFRLALLNTFFVMLALSIALSVVLFQTRQVFMGSIDRELFARAERMMGNPNLRDRDNPLQPLLNGGEGPNGPPETNPGLGEDQQRPNGQMFLNRQIGSMVGPEFAGPPNNDISRPIAITVNGEPVDPRQNRILDRKALENKQLMHPIIVTLPVENVPTRVITVPLRSRHMLLGFAQYGHDLKDFDRLKQTQTTTILFLLPFAILGSAVVGWFLAGLAVRPIEKFASASERVSESDMSVRLEVTSNDEIGRLAQSFNGMIERLQLSFNERQRLTDEIKAALEQQKQFVGDASHELRTPLTRLRITTSSALEQESSPDEMKEALEIADRETVHMSNLVDQLLTLARLDSGRTPNLTRISLRDVIKEAVSRFPTDAPNAVMLDIHSDGSILGDQDGLVRALINLIENARRYCPDQPIVVSLQEVDNQAMLVVRDHGSGIEAVHIPRLTERFYRVDDARNRKMGGTGLGLAIVKSIVEASQGRMVIQSKVGEGTAVQLIFPISA